jgi:hypothetical protein
MNGRFTGLATDPFRQFIVGGCLSQFVRECAYESGFGFYLLAKVGAWGAFVLPRVLLFYFVRTLYG